MLIASLTSTHSAWSPFNVVSPFFTGSFINESRMVEKSARINTKCEHRAFYFLHFPFS